MTDEQKHELAESMASLFKEAEVTGKWLRNVYFEETFSVQKLRALQAQGKYVQGAAWWSLVERPNFTRHQGEWDTLTLEEHEARRAVVQADTPTA